MRKSSFIAFFLMGLLLGFGFILFGEHLSQALPMNNYFCSPSFWNDCPVCQTGTSGGLPGCWAWNGGRQYLCQTQTGSTCDPAQAQIICTGIFYAGGDCSGLLCSGNTCCVRGVVTNGRQQFMRNTCVP